MSQLFISYAHVDKRQARELAEILQEGGHDAWFDHSLVVGRDWKEQLLHEIRRCDAFVYALTPESVASEWCQWEFEQAVLLEKPIIPVLLRKNTTLPDALKRYQYADFTDGPTVQSTARLLRGVGVSGLQTVAVTVPLDTLPANLIEPHGLPEKALPDPEPPSEIGSLMTAFLHAANTGDLKDAKGLLGQIQGTIEVDTETLQLVYAESKEVYQRLLADLEAVSQRAERSVQLTLVFLAITVALLGTISLHDLSDSVVAFLGTGLGFLASSVFYVLVNNALTKQVYSGTIYPDVLYNRMNEKAAALKVDLVKVIAESYFYNQQLLLRQGRTVAVAQSLQIVGVLFLLLAALLVIF